MRRYRPLLFVLVVVSEDVVNVVAHSSSLGTFCSRHGHISDQIRPNQFDVQLYGQALPLILSVNGFV